MVLTQALVLIHRSFPHVGLLERGVRSKPIPSPVGVVSRGGRCLGRVPSRWAGRFTLPVSQLTGRSTYVGPGMAPSHECGASIPGAIWLSCISCRSGPARGSRVPAPDTYHLSLTGIPLVTWYFAIGICHGCFLTCL